MISSPDAASAVTVGIAALARTLNVSLETRLGDPIPSPVSPTSLPAPVLIDRNIGTRVVLLVTHLAAAAVITPTLARQLGD